ncbi:MAG: triose-phosphate isomerase [Nitrospina sp.]|nr:triose-phosphate isomerase [Nitrospina sp.]
MNLLAKEATELARGILDFADENKYAKVVLAPSFTLLHGVGQVISGTGVGLASQNFFYQEKGAYTGEVSAGMIKEIGCEYAIVGHSERRQLFGETDELVNKKALCAIQNNITAIICVGETGEHRNTGKTFEIIEQQIRKALVGIENQDLEKIIIAYEPIWAIGTGENATADQANEVHCFIRKIVAEINSGNQIGSLSILYGGSVTPDNCEELLQNPEINGALVGGASLKINSFCDIIRSANKK